MTFIDLFFYFISTVILVTASSAVFSFKIITSVKSILISLISITIVFFLLRADYLAILYLLIFVLGTGGAIVFLAMNSGHLKGSFKTGGSLVPSIIAAVFTALLAGTLISTKWKEVQPSEPGLSVWEVTGLLQSVYFLPMITLVVIIFIGLIGNSFMARKN
jgi:NADH:ubiquinone oxidoreductase subunit 6 (subunit J)